MAGALPGFQIAGLSEDNYHGISKSDRKIIDQTKWPSLFNKKVDVKKVRLETLRPWLEKRFKEVQLHEDDILVDFCMEQLNDDRKLCPRELTTSMGAFLHEAARPLVEQLWQLLLSAQAHPSGIPPKFIEERKAELLEKQEEADRIEVELKKRKELLSMSNSGSGGINRIHTEVGGPAEMGKAASKLIGLPRVCDDRKVDVDRNTHTHTHTHTG
eukprot:GHVR01053896.1.p1 GENE.GHVR01053896.1~~GHVR01053896.1.p1  ORF type:complete len:214 (+),score=74.50 GHVR01053896.1:30-671(+)